ncbi:hypothetical protein [Chitinimonas sp.]|uniref:hypothetical protein n=1 Tax=Chitinimonas sp. TaxID=1934313 RepID=UPI0035B48352
MAVGTCSSCFKGGLEALQAYQRQALADDRTQQQLQQQAAIQASLQLGENRPRAGAVSGSVINVSV